MNQITVLEIVNTHGLRGEVRALYFADSPDFFHSVEYLLTPQGEKLHIENLRAQKGALLIKFREINAVEEAEKMKGTALSVSPEQLESLPEDTYYISELLGSRIETADGEYLGTLFDMVEAGSGYIMEIQKENKKHILIPFVDEFLEEVNASEKRIKVKLIEGLADEI